MKTQLSASELKSHNSATQVKKIDSELSYSWSLHQLGQAQKQLETQKWLRQCYEFV